MVPAASRQPALFDSRQLDEFGVGQISKCLGPAFARYDQQRIPRIPNGDLKLMSRVTEINGKARDFSQPASITVAYDVPADAWYLRDNAYPEVPWSVWMEIALQPCGFLSAYLDTYASVPHDRFYFRNLDGSIRWMVQPGAVIDACAGRQLPPERVCSRALSAEKQSFKSFLLNCLAAGQPICQGESLFGYFSFESMNNQVGLDGGREVSTLAAHTSRGGAARNSSKRRAASPRQAEKPHFRLSQGQLNLLDDIFVLPAGGKHGLGYVYASRPVNQNDWFYPCHFFQDPVMPGSLGVEAVLQAVQAYALANNLGQIVSLAALWSGCWPCTNGLAIPRSDYAAAPDDGS
jgi:3-hydroxymyristoyl/3-hydroxydecanoyl-(acyl carrier protein) dehydratase